MQIERICINCILRKFLQIYSSNNWPINNRQRKKIQILINEIHQLIDIFIGGNYRISWAHEIVKHTSNGTSYYILSGFNFLEFTCIFILKN